MIEVSGDVQFVIEWLLIGIGVMTMVMVAIDLYVFMTTKGKRDD